MGKKDYARSATTPTKVKRFW